jgi:hypothetical protein
MSISVVGLAFCTINAFVYIFATAVAKISNDCSLDPDCSNNVGNLYLLIEKLTKM